MAWTNRKQKFQGVNIHDSQYSWVRKYQGTKVPKTFRSGSESSWERIGQGPIGADSLHGANWLGSKRLWIIITLLYKPNSHNYASTGTCADLSGQSALVPKCLTDCMCVLICCNCLYTCLSFFCLVEKIWFTYYYLFTRRFALFLLLFHCKVKVRWMCCLMCYPCVHFLCHFKSAVTWF